MQAGDGVRGFAGPAGVGQAAEQIEQFTEERGKMTWGEIIIIRLLLLVVAEVYQLHKRIGLLGDVLEAMAKQLNLR